MNTKTLKFIIDNYSKGKPVYSKMVNLFGWGWTEDDGELAEKQIENPVIELPRMNTHQHGWLIFCNGEEDTYIPQGIAMKEAGFSHDLVIMYCQACKDGALIIDLSV